MNALDSQAEIAEAAEALLRRAGAVGRLPTPVEDLVAAANLTEPEQSMLSASVLKDAPAHLRAAVSKLAGRLRGLIDRRELEVHVAPEVRHEARRNFIKLHETGHHILHWQRDLAYADDDATLSPATRELFELEASQCAAELLFQGDRFTSDAADVEAGLPGMMLSAKRYGSSLRSGLRRYTETHRAAMLSVVVDMSPESMEPLRYRRHEVNMSSAYVKRFGNRIWPGHMSIRQYGFLATVAAATASPGTIISGAWTRTDLAGTDVALSLDAFCTGYDVLVLVWVPFGERTRKRVRLVA
jgi:hypothetical protein